MQHFSKLEALRVAMEIERNGYDFYIRARRYADNPDVNALLARLIDDEILHCQRFQELFDDIVENDSDSQPFNQETINLLSAIAVDIAHPSSVMRIALSGEALDPISILEEGLRWEDNSCLFYAQVIPHAESENDRAVFQEILDQEKSHRADLVELLTALRV